MPKLVRLYIRHVLIGFGISAAVVSGLLYLNVANLWHLVSTSDMGWIAVLMLFVFNGIVFASVQFSIVIMRMAQDDPPAGGPKKRVGPMVGIVPIPVRVEKDGIKSL